MPKINNLPFIPMSAPFGERQLATTFDARHREFGTPTRCHLHFEPLIFFDIALPKALFRRSFRLFFCIFTLWLTCFAPFLFQPLCQLS
jgi:hypothetical protein